MIAFRGAGPGDADALLAFWSEAAENAAGPTDSAAAIRRLIARDPDALIIAEDAGEIVGTVIAGFDGWRYHLYRLAVSPARRREGLGRALLARAEGRLQNLGAGRLDAMVLDGNELGEAIWRSSGYTPQPEWRRWVHSLD